MKSSILTIGNELLCGYTIDSNAAWIGRKLIDIGIKTVWKSSVLDHNDEIVSAMSMAAQKADIIICTGGLGPTRDDVTLDAYREFTGSDLELDAKYLHTLKSKFERRGVIMPESNRNQALVPNKGDVIPNPKGSARGFSCYVDGVLICILPGVPLEMKTMMEETVLPKLESMEPSEIFVTNIRTTGVMESKLHDLLEPSIVASSVSTAFLPGFSGVDIRLASNDKSAVKTLAGDIYSLAGKYVYAEDWVTLEESVGKYLLDMAKTLAIAESCTGGLLGDRITNIPGCSQYFAGGVICYSNEAKIKLAGVKKSTLDSFGAVSENVAAEMASGIRKKLSADIGISITGISGPEGGSKEKPIGLTCFGLDDGVNKLTRSIRFFSDRRFNKELSAQAALNILRLRLSGQNDSRKSNI